MTIRLPFICCIKNKLQTHIVCNFLSIKCCRGMTVTSGSVVLNKDEKNLIGISIGGGAPLCPCLYIVQVSSLYSKIGIGQM